MSKRFFIKNYRFKRRIKKVRTEESIQMQLTNYIKRTYPDILWTASAGGMRTSIGTAVKMKATGYSKGCPDILIFEPRGQYHGLMIELKQEEGRPTPEQTKWIDKLNQRKYMAYITYGFNDTQEIIDGYLIENKL